MWRPVVCWQERYFLLLGGFTNNNVTKISTGELMSTPFLPFTTDLWLVLLAAVVVHACAYYASEGLGESNQPVVIDTVSEADAAQPDHGRRTGDLRARHALRHAQGVYKELGNVLGTIQDTNQQPGTGAGILMKFGLAFLLFFAINLWASGLTTSLVASSVLSNRPASLKEATDRGYRICASGSFGNALKLGKVADTHEHRHGNGHERSWHASTAISLP